jgi:hypothetical protein
VRDVRDVRVRGDHVRDDSVRDMRDDPTRVVRDAPVRDFRKSQVEFERELEAGSHSQEE